MLTDNEGYEIIRKPERNRIVGETIIPSYGKFEVHNTKFNKIIKYITEKNKQYNEKITNPTEKQKALNEVLQQQLDLYRLKVLYDNWKRISNENDNKLALQELMLYLTTFRAFCGKGTDIYKQIKEDNDNPSGMFNIDRICRDHDVSFTHARTIEDQQTADKIFISQILQKYIVDYETSILGKNPQSFDTWKNGFDTIRGYIMSSLEGIVSTSLIFTGWNIVKTGGKAIAELALSPSRIIEGVQDINWNLVNQAKQILRTASQATRYTLGHQANYIPPSIRTPYKYASHLTQTTGYQLYYTLRELSNAVNPDIRDFVLSAGFTNLIKDKFLASVSLLFITGKFITEKIILDLSPSFLKDYFMDNGIFVGIKKDEIREEDITNIIKMYSGIQNEILKESNMPEIEPITEKDYENVELDKNPETLINEFKDIYMMNNENITIKFDRNIQEQPPQYTEEQKEQAEIVYDDTIENPIGVIDTIINYFQSIDDSIKQYFENPENKPGYLKYIDENFKEIVYKTLDIKPKPQTKPEIKPETIPEINDDEEFLEWYFAKEIPEINDDEEFLEWYFAKEIP